MTVWRAWWLIAAILMPFVVRGGPVDFALRDLDGQVHRLSDYRGKWVVVNYWATWCPPCLEEIPELEVFHTHHKDKDAVVLGVNLEEISLESLRRFIDEQFISYPVLRSVPRRQTEVGPIPGMPTTYLISPSGEAVARQIGGITRRVLEDFLVRHGAIGSQGKGAQ